MSDEELKELKELENSKSRRSMTRNQSLRITDMEVLLRENERVDDLQRNGYRIIQNPAKFCFGMDAVLLSGFVRVKQDADVLDMGTGTGIIPLLLAAKTRAAHISAIEIQAESADMARRSVQLNNLTDKIDIVIWGYQRSRQNFPCCFF